MKFLILHIDYGEFLRWFYAQHPGLEKKSYEEQMWARLESLFAWNDFYSSNLCKLGHEAWDIYVNNEFMQKAWAREQGIQVEEPAPIAQRWYSVLQQARHVAAQTPLRYLKPLFRQVLRSLDRQTWFYDILAAQIKHYKPDVLLNKHMDVVINPRFWQEMKSYVRLLVGQVAFPLPQEDFGCYDIVISSLPNFINYFRNLGIPSELSRLAFEPRVLEKLRDNDRNTIPVSFVGSVSPNYTTRIRWLDYLCRVLDIKIWGHGIERLDGNSPIHRCCVGKAWGVEMYRILHSSKITLNRHIDAADVYANNLRLFEATGVGTLLVTDWKVNLYEMFEPGKEVVTYRSSKECAELIKYYLEHDEERETIACAGQQRTFREHTYYQRMQELVGIVRKYL